VLGLIAGGYVAVALTRQVLAVAGTYGATQLAWAASNDLRATLVRHSLELDLSFHGIHPPGEMLERVDGDVTAVSSFVSSFLLRVVGSGLTLVGVLAVILLEDWRVGLGLVGFAAVAAVTIGRMRNSAVPQATVSGTSTPWTLMVPNRTGVTPWTPGAGRSRGGRGPPTSWARCWSRWSPRVVRGGVAGSCGGPPAAAPVLPLVLVTDHDAQPGQVGAQLGRLVAVALVQRPGARLEQHVGAGGQVGEVVDPAPGTGPCTGRPPPARGTRGPRMRP
jgi:hypothetical protein